jgi:hypothetical protein
VILTASAVYSHIGAPIGNVKHGNVYVNVNLYTCHVFQNVICDVTYVQTNRLGTLRCV